MAHLDYAELQVTSNFSLLKGGSHPQELVRRASELDYRAIGITDLHSLAGIVRAHVAAKEVNLQLAVGTRVHPRSLPLLPTELLSNLQLPNSLLPSSLLPFSLLLYATDVESYGRLSTLLTTGKLRTHKGECLLTIEDIARYNSGLVAIVINEESSLEAISSSLSPHLESLKEIFNQDRLSLAISNSYSLGQHLKISQLTELSRQHQIPLVATNNILYHIPERRILQDVLTCIREHSTIDSAGYALSGNAERFLKSKQEIAHLFRHLPKALTRTVEIAERTAGFSLSQLRYHYPQEICPKGQTPAEHLHELVSAGIKEHYPNGIPAAVLEQIRRELQIIRELDYEKYFLTVNDIVRFARSREILCQGRGAAANSAVCYVLGITAVDPAQIRLLFERFISKERNEPPDIDIDFEHERREEVIQYLYNRYGRLRAALTAEVICYRTKSSVRDTAKVFGLPEETTTALLRAKTRASHRQISRERLLELGVDPDSRAIQHTLAISEILKSFPRHLSQHVGGFIVSDPPLCNTTPIENAAMPNRTTIEWDKDDIENLGILKVDVLALGMLTCIRKGMEMINLYELHPERLTLHSLPREDKKVYDMICRGETLGVFQIESRAQMAMLPRMKPRCFYDLVVQVAIVRPGPIQGGMVHPYLRRRQGKERAYYPNEKIKKILESTLGVPIFQEQVMELAVVAAGFSAGEADQLRRAMASWKKDENALLAFEERFKGGMRKNGYDESFAAQVFEQMKGFGEYGFPQSHAASFALLVYASAWIKCHYPTVFAAALLNSQPMGFYLPAQIIEEAKRAGVRVLPIDVNFSFWDCSLEYLREDLSGQTKTALALRLGMRLVRGAQKSEIEKLYSLTSLPSTSSSPTNRHNSYRPRYRSLLSLWKETRCLSSQLKHLARADAFQSLGLGRQEAMWQIQKLRDERLPLFEGLEEAEPEVSLPTLSQQLQVYRDYSTTGLSLRAHPLSFARPILDSAQAITIEQFKNLRHNQRAAIAGIVLVRQRPMTAKGVLFVTLEDETGMANLIVKPEILAKYLDQILDSTVLLVQGRIQSDSGVVHLIVEEAVDASYICVNEEEFEPTSRDFR